MSTTAEQATDEQLHQAMSFFIARGVAPRGWMSTRSETEREFARRFPGMMGSKGKKKSSRR